jgi:hypothetical protein
MIPKDMFSRIFQKMSTLSHFSLGLDVGRCYSRQNELGIGSIYVDDHSTKTKLVSYYSQKQVLFTPFFSGTLPLEGLEIIRKLMHFSDSSK